MERKQQGNRRDVYAEVTRAIVDQLEAGVVPWHRPWNAEQGLPVSMSTRRSYRGVNVFLLGMAGQAAGYSSSWWGTYKQIGELGGQVRKGEKSSVVVFWKVFERKATSEERARGLVKVRVPMLRHFNVFNACQADGLGAGFYGAPASTVLQPVAECERIVSQWVGRPLVVHGGDRAFYSPGLDRVQVPAREAFESADGYYSTLFHELTHSTGHASRLARPTLLEAHAFGDESYSKEELVAEMGAAMLSGVAGIEQLTVPQSAAYIASWLRALKGDPRLVIGAAAQAQKAADMILGADKAGDDDVQAAAGVELEEVAV